MNLERLKLFVEIVESGSISEASRRAHLTQPAVSRNLKCLEDELGTALFDRTGHRLVLTSAGRALLPSARLFLAQAQQIERDVQRAASQKYFDLRLGAINSVLTFLLPEALRALKKKLPDLHIKLFGARTQALLGKLQGDELDLILVAHHGEPPAQRHYKIGPYRMQFWGRADTFPGLAQVKTEGELQAFPIIEIESLPGQPSLISPGAQSFAVATSLESVKALVMAGFGVGALLDFMLSPAEREALTLSQVPSDPTCALYLIASPWRQDEALTQIEHDLRDHIRDRMLSAMPEPSRV